MNCPICMHGYRTGDGSATLEHMVERHGLTVDEATALALVNVYGIRPTLITDEDGDVVAIAIQLALQGL